MVPGSEIGIRDRSDADPGRDRHDGDARVGSNGPRPRPDRAVGAVRRPQPVAGRLPQRGRPPVPAERVPALRTLVQQARQRRQPPGPHATLRHPGQDASSVPTVTRAPPARSGMLAIGAGGIEAAMAMAGEPFHLTMPQIWGVRLVGELPDWVSAKDVILEMLRRHDVKGGLGRIIEYHGPGLAGLSAMDRHVIANMGAELGATTTVFPVRRSGSTASSHPKVASTTGSS